MFLKTHRVRKDGKEHIYYSLCESMRVSRSRVTQRTVLHLGELNTTQVDRWERTIETVQENGQRQQLRLFTDRQGQAPAAEDVAEVILSSLVVRRPRRFGECWIGCKLWEELGLRAFWDQSLGEERGQVLWAKVVELLVVNRLCAPRSELSVHEKWFAQTAMDLLLDSDGSVAEKDRLYRCLDRMIAHKEALERHLAGKWRDLFGATFDVLLYDLTSSYFEGEALEVDKARRGYSRDHRPDCLQILLALVVTPEGFPLSYEVLPGNVRDEGTLEGALEGIERKHGKARRIWVFDRGVVSEANLEKLRERGAQYVVGTPRSQLKQYEQQLLQGEWQDISKEVKVQLLAQGQETFVLARSEDRARKEQAMRWRQVRGLMRDLVCLRRSIRRGLIKDPDKILMRVGRLAERWSRAWAYLTVKWEAGRLSWRWDRQALGLAALRDGAYLLRTNLKERTPEALWKMYVQLTEVESVFRAMKSQLAIRPIWHWVGRRVEAHVMVAFLGYCLWVCLKQKLKAVAPSLTPWQLLDQFGRIVQVEVWFKLRAGGAICLPRITQPEPTQAILLHQLGWSLPEQPPPKIYKDQVPDVWTT
ncbi:MAG: IS1634 family transposase [Verrucomicrobia bacterium]|nr:MAG: IS1634 family transposase [Verrucomicrobiota bacterium]PYK57851.1 MAG: IS1634 family transposase [Verrucomicrobiota bacterium]